MESLHLASKAIRTTDKTHLHLSPKTPALRCRVTFFGVDNFESNYQHCSQQEFLILILYLSPAVTTEEIQDKGISRVCVLERDVMS